jgi:hypothetical protein
VRRRAQLRRAARDPICRHDPHASGCGRRPGPYVENLPRPAPRGCCRARPKPSWLTRNLTLENMVAAGACGVGGVAGGALGAPLGLGGIARGAVGGCAAGIGATKWNSPTWP